VRVEKLSIFDDIGPSTSTLIQYFEGNGSRQCGPEENPCVFSLLLFWAIQDHHISMYLSLLLRAEFILNVIGVGATAASKVDWHQTWIDSLESALLDNEIDGIVAHGRDTSAVSATIGSAFAAPWAYQIWSHLGRNFATLLEQPNVLDGQLDAKYRRRSVHRVHFFRAQ
jgi:ATP-binding cassette, subfamily G (WHITE), member 2, SNQ2